MRMYSDKKSRLNKVKHRYHKCLTHDIKKYINGWFYVYCENTSLHGFRYVTKDKSIIEGALWFTICILAMVFCVILMIRLWNNYSNNPIVTTIDTSNPIWDVSFPGVTICNNNKVYRPHADIIAEYLYTFGYSVNESEKFFSSLMKLIRPDKISIENVTTRQILNDLDMTVEMLMKQLMQPCSALLVRCAWVGEIHDCSKIFKTVKSREGFCCAFNSHYDLNLQHKFNDTDHPSQVQDNSTGFNTSGLPGVNEILKVPGSGRDVGLAVALNVEPNMYKTTTRPYVGASVMIHDPIDFPDIGADMASVSPGHVLAISVTGTSIRSLDSLHGLPIEKRLCYFDDEIPGEIRYSYQSCISECIAEQVQRICGCLPFYYPENHDGIRTCYLSDLTCLLNRRKLMPDYARMENCKKCLPQCSDMLYHVNLDGVKMDDIGYDSDLTRGFDIHNTSFVYVFFGDVSYVEYRKESTISWDSLLASFGGIFGLCLGGSVISVIEVIYLLTTYFVKRQFRKKQDQSHKNLPPASDIFLSIPAEKIQMKKSRNHQELNNKRIFVMWYQGKTMKFGDVNSTRNKF